jgi:hypothetical protein
MLLDIDVVRKRRRVSDSALAATLLGMKSMTCLFVLAPLAIVSLAVPAFLAPSVNARQAAGEPSLDESMQSLQAGFKGLDRAIGKGEVDKALELVVDMQKAAQDAKLGMPVKAADVTDAAEKAKFLSGYRLKVIDLQRALLDVEAALVHGKPEDAKKVLDTQIKALKKEGHDTFKD